MRKSQGQFNHEFKIALARAKKFLISKNIPVTNLSTDSIIRKYSEVAKINIPSGIGKFIVSEYRSNRWSPIYKNQTLPDTPKEKIRKKKFVKKENGKTEYDEYLKSVQWKNFKLSLILIRGKKCEACGATNKRLDGHHLTYERLGNELPEDVQLLCRNCHENIHNRRFGSIKAA